MTRELRFFEDLIGKDFILGNQKVPKEFPMYYDESRTQKLDIEKGDKWKSSPERRLYFKQKMKDFSKPKLLKWLDENIKRKEHSQDEKRKYLAKLIKSLLESKKYKFDISKLTLNMYKITISHNFFLFY